MIAMDPIVLPTENPGDDEFVAAAISILILFLLFYDFFPFAGLPLAELVRGTLEAESELIMGTNCANGNIIGILPKKIINRTTPNNNICPPIIKIKSDVEVSITHLSMSTIFM
jgi:hypothetical protein